MKSLLLFLILFSTLFITGCIGGGSGGGGGNSAISTTTPEQEFFQYRMMFNEMDTSTNHKKLLDIQKKLEKLKRNSDDRGLVDNTNYVLAILKSQKAFLQSMKNDSLEEKSYEENMELFDKSLDSLRDSYEKRPEELDISMFIAYTLQNYLTYKKIAGKLTEDECLQLLDEIQHHVKRVVLSNSDYQSKFSLYGKPLMASDLEWVRVDAFISVGMVSVAKTILDTMLKQEPQVSYNPFYRLQKAKLLLKLRQYQEASQILNEFRLPQLEDFPLRGFALWLLSSTMEQLEKLDPEQNQEDRKAVEKQRKDGEDFFSKQKMIDFNQYIGILTPTDKDINTAYLYLKEGNPKAAELFLKVAEDKNNSYLKRFNGLYFLKNYLLTDVFASNKEFSGRIFQLAENLIQSRPYTVELNHWIQMEIDYLSGNMHKEKELKFDVAHVWFQENPETHNQDLWIEIVRTMVDKGLDVSEEYALEVTMRTSGKKLETEKGSREMIHICPSLLEKNSSLQDVVDIKLIESDTGKYRLFSFPLIVKRGKK